MDPSGAKTTLKNLFGIVFQINFQMTPNDRVTGFANLPKVLFPLFWTYGIADLLDEAAEKMSSSLTYTFILEVIFIYIIGFGLSTVGIMTGMKFLYQAGKH